MKHLKLIAIFFALTSASFAQKSTVAMPRDANNHPLSHGLGAPTASSLAIDVTSYNATDSYTLPSTGENATRAFRHFYIFNRSTTRTVTVCFASAASSCDDAMVVRPEYAMIFEPILFGAAVGKGTVYFKLDSAGTANIDIAAW